MEPRALDRPALLIGVGGMLFLCYRLSMGRVRLAEILELPVGERVKIVQAIWDSVSEVPEPFPLSEAEREKLDRRLEAYRENPNAASPWAEVKARILRRA